MSRKKNLTNIIEDIYRLLRIPKTKNVSNDMENFQEFLNLIFNLSYILEYYDINSFINNLILFRKSLNDEQAKYFDEQFSSWMTLIIQTSIVNDISYDSMSALIAMLDDKGSEEFSREVKRVFNIDVDRFLMNFALKEL